MVEMHSRWPEYEFATHKGYVTPVHAAALKRHGPCPEHRFSYVNVRRVGGRAVLVTTVREDDVEDEVPVLRQSAVAGHHGS